MKPWLPPAEVPPVHPDRHSGGTALPARPSRRRIIGDLGGNGAAPLPEEPEPAVTARPSVPRAADLAPLRCRPVWVILCFTVTLIVYLSFIPRILAYSSPPTGDQPFYLMDTVSLVQDGDLNVANNYDQKDFDKFYALAPHPPDFVGISAPYPLPRQLAQPTVRPEGEQYAFHLPGLGVMLVPAWMIGAAFQLWWPATIAFMCILGALLVVNAALLAYEVSGQLWVGLMVWLPVAFSLPVMIYSYLIFTELPVGVLAIYAFRRLAQGWRANGPARLALVGLCIAFIPWLAWRCVLLAGPLAVYAAIQWWRASRMDPADLETAPWGNRSRRSLPGVLLFGLPLLLTAVLIPAYNIFLFGKPLPDTTVPELGNRSPFHWPWGGPDDLKKFVDNAYGLLFDQNFGLLIYAPIYVLTAVGLIALFRSRRIADRRLLLALGGVSLPYLGLIVSFELWTGIWCPPARYLTTFVPLAAAPLGMALITLHRGLAGILFKILYGVLALPGFAFMGMMLYDPRLAWPTNPLRSSLFEQMALNPQAPFHVDLRAFLPSYMLPDEVLQPTQVGWLLGGVLAVVLGCYILLVLRQRSWGRGLRLRAVQSLSWLGTFALIGGTWYSDNYDYLQHKTVLLEQHRWALPAPLPDARGIAFWQGKLYMSAFGQRQPSGEVLPGRVDVLDPATGHYETFQPQGPSGPLTWTNPGDIQAGPDGLLYVLNNGPADAALWAFNSDGQLVRKITLAVSTPVRRGLYIAGDGSIYIADTVGGSIYKYGPNGGVPVASWHGSESILNNPSGVWVNADGSVFTTESFERVQQLDAKGTLLHRYDTGCPVLYFAQSPKTPDWLDLICARGVRSIHLSDGLLQRARTGGGTQPALRSPLALAYAPDGRLYLFDSVTVIEYSVSH